VASTGASSHTLQILDPVTLASHSIPLAKAPLCVSVSPGGTFAAVGHESLVTYVDLSGKTVVKTFAVTGSVTDLVLAVEWIHLRGASIRVATGAVVAFPSSHFTGARLQAGGAAIFATEPGPAGKVLWKYDVSTGPMSAAESSEAKRYSVIYPACEGAWPSSSGARVYTGCGNAFESDLGYASSFPGMGGVRGVAEIPGLKWVAALASSRDSRAKDNEVFVFESDFLERTNHFVLGDFESGGTKYEARGRWIFAGTSSLYVISQAAAGFPVENDYGLAEIPTAAPAESCPSATFSTSISEHSFWGEVKRVDIVAPPGCLWNLEVSFGDRPKPWFEIHGPQWGSGNQTISIRTQSRYGDFSPEGRAYPGLRIGSVRLGSRSLTLSQEVALGPSHPLRLNIKFAGADFSTAIARMILIGSEPPRLLAQLPEEPGYQERPVVRTPLAVAVERSKAPYPDPSYEVLLSGVRAAVAHDGWIALYSLDFGMPLIQHIKVPGRPTKLAWVQTGFLYALAGTDLFSIDVATREQRVVRLPKSATRIIVNNEATILYADEIRIDLSAGFAVLPASQPENIPCPGPRFFTERTAMLVDLCGAVLTSSANSSTDQAPSTSLSSVANGVIAAAYALEWPATALLTPSTSIPGSPVELQIYDGALLYSGKRMLASFSSLIPTYGNDSLRWYGTDLFWLTTSGGSYVRTPAIGILVRADPASGLVSDYGILPYRDSRCDASRAEITRSQFDSSGGDGELSVTIGDECMWFGLSADPWITFPGRRLSIGTNTIPFRVSPNTGSTPRNGTIYAGNTKLAVSGNAGSAKATGLAAVTPNDRPFTISQAAVVVPTTVFTPSSFTASSRLTSFVVNVLSSETWTVSSIHPWILVPNATTYSGNAQIQVTVRENTGPYARSAGIIIAGRSLSIHQAANAGYHFYPIAPCRVADTRNAPGTFGGPFMPGLSERSFPIPSSPCGIPSNAEAYALNVTIIPRRPFGYLSIYPAGQSRPLVSTMNSLDGRIKATAAIVRAGSGGSVTSFVTDDTDLILDINGYFAPPQSGLVFHPLTPCRAVDTRNPTGLLGGPELAPQTTRTFPIRGACGIPTEARAYSTNITAVPRGPLGYVTISPTGQVRPTVSTLNAVTGAVTANAAIAIAGTNGSIDVFATETTDLIVDVNGYFAPPGANGGLRFFPVDSCRVADSRNATGPLGGPILGALSTREYWIPGSACEVPTFTGAYSLNVTTVPTGPLGFLTLFPTGNALPLVSTLNAVDGYITSNGAIVPASGSGSTSVFVTHATHVILDINGYFTQ
jgi:hypothetical protein